MGSSWFSKPTLSECLLHVIPIPPLVDMIQSFLITETLVKQLLQKGSVWHPYFNDPLVFQDLWLNYRTQMVIPWLSHLIHYCLMMQPDITFLRICCTYGSTSTWIYISKTDRNIIEHITPWLQQLDLRVPNHVTMQPVTPCAEYYFSQHPMVAECSLRGSVLTLRLNVFPSLYKVS